MEPSRRPHVLLVDDDISTIQVLWCLLSDEAQIRFAKTCEQALVLAQAQVPELILLDLELPDGHGLDLCRRLRQDPRLGQVPVIVVTAHADPAQQLAALEAGAADFIAKPLQAAQVVARVRAQLRQRAGDAPGTARPPGAAAAPPETLRVLIVDDDVVAIKMLRNALEAMPVQFHFATRGDDALRLAADLRPHIILLDAQLPGLDGYEVCRRLKASATLAGIPVIFVTRSDDPLAEAQALEAGAVDFVAKPCMPAVLKARVQRALRLGREPAVPPDAADPRWQRWAGRHVDALAAAHPDALVVFDAAGRIETLNAAARARLGVNLADVTGRAPDALWQSARRLGAADEAAEPLDTGDDLLDPARGPQRLQLTRIDGGDCQVLATATCAGAGEARVTVLTLRVLPAGTDAVHFGMLDDESPTRLLTAARVGLATRAAADELVALTARLRGSQGADPALTAALQAGARHLARLSRDQADLIGATTGQGPPDCVAVDLSGCLRRALNRLRRHDTAGADPGGAAVGGAPDPQAAPPINARIDALIATLPAGLPPVAADPLRLQLCMERLLASALDGAAAPGEVSLHLVPSDAGRQLRLTVQAPAWDWTARQVERLRWPLPDGDQAAPSDLGALGLAVTHHLLTALGADVSLGGPPQRPPTVEVALPCWGADLPDDALVMPE